MKKKAILFGIVIALVMIFSGTISAFAVKNYPMDYKPGTTDTVTNLPAEGTGTGGEHYTVSSQIPQRAGYEFIDWTLDYDVVVYKVTYVVNPDKTYKMPEDSTVPEDKTEYAPNDYVTVAAQLTTTKDYAYNENNEKVLGTWTFTPWDKADFEITEDTTITGGWTFEPAPAKTYHYTVYYKLYEGDPSGGIELNIPTSGDVLPFTEVNIDAIPVTKLSNKKYRTKTQIYPGFQHVDVKITHDNFVITIWYLPKGGTG